LVAFLGQPYLAALMILSSTSKSKKEANDWALATIGKVQALGRGNEKTFYGLGDTENNVDETHEIR
jgi:hypothetical protein